MNKVYRNVWNENTQTWVAASELANSKTKSNTVCELPLVKHVLNIFGLKKIVSLTLTTLALQLQAVSPAYAANLAITGTSNISTNGTGVSYASGSHGSIALAGDDDFCGADKVNGRRNITTGGISAMEEYLRFAQNRSFNGRNPYGTSNGQQVWTGDGTTGGNTSGSSGYMGAPTGGDTNKLPVAYGVYSFASGCGSYATGNYSTAFGNNATATAGGAQAFGVAALASGATAVAIGVGAQATNTASLALGSVATSDGAGSVAVGFNSAAQQDNTTALGANAIATVEKAVALGSDSLANTSAGIQGYDPAGTNTATENQSATWKSTAAAVSIGNANTQITRQITGLAAGTADTDAVNVAQLKNLASSTSTGLSNLSTAINSNLNGLNNNVANLQKDALQWNGTAYDASHGTANAQRITNVAAGQIGENSTDAINAGQLFSVSTSTAASLSTLSSTLNQAGDLSNVNANISTINSNINGLNNNVANLQKDALQWNGTAYDASHGTANAQRITNVAAGQIGENSTDAINAGQLFSVSTSTAASLSTLSSTLNQAGDLSNVNANISTINSNINGLNNNVANLQKDALQWNGSAYDASHGTANAQRITNVAAGHIGENSTDAINAGQLFSVSTSTAASLSTLSSTLNQAGDLSNVNANISTINSNINGLNNNVANLQKDALQWNGTAYDASHGTANAQRITNVAAGHIGENSTDAINAGQLFSVSTSTAASLSTLSSTLNQAGDLSNVNANISTINSNINGLNNNVANLQKDALQWNGSAYDASHGTANAQRITNVAAGHIGENSTDAINAGQLFSVSTSTAASLSTLSSTLNQAGDLSNVNANITTINSNLNGLNNNVANLQKDALQWNGTAYDASHGTANAQRITNVAAGQIGENSTDAINAGQLFSVSTSTAASLSTLSSTLNQAGDLSNVNANINTINSNINGLNNNVANLQKDALQWNGSAYDASHGTANAQRITNVAAGQIGENSTDAINAGQLFSVSTSTAASLSTLSSTLNQAGDLSNVNANINTINSNINGLNNNVANLQKDALQWNGTAYDASHGTANTQRITNVAVGDTGEYSTDAVNGGQLYSLSSSTMSSVNNLSTTFSDNLSTGLSTANSRIDTVAQSTTTLAGNLTTAVNSISTLQKDALQWNGTAYDASHGTANAQRITNVAAGQIGENSTDAINAGQLFSVSTSTAASLSTLSSTLNQAGDLSNVNANINTINSNINGLNNNVANLQKDALQWNGSAYDASHGTANAQRITNVAVGDTGEYSTDAVNGGQLYSLSSSTMSSVNNLSTTFSDNLSTGLSTANSRIDTVAQSTTTLASNLTTAVNSISTLQKDALQWNGSAYDASHGTANAQRITNVAAGQIGENSTDAINAGQLFSVSTSTAASLSTLSSTLNQAGDLSNVNANINTINSNINGLNNNVANLQKDALQWNGTAYDASHGTANAQRITNVAVGDTGEYSTDAVNGGQLYSLSSSTVSSVNNLSTTFSSNLSTGLSTANSRIDTVAQSTTTLASNLTTAVNSISTLQKDALQWNGSAYDASHGTANAQRITNVANGTIGENSTDAVNGGQLYSLSSSIMSSVSSTVDNVVNENKINLEAVNRDIRTAQTALQTAQNDIKTAQDDILTSKKLIEALQKNSVHFDDIIDDTTPGFFGLTRDTTERTISNIANGRVDATSNQAVNGRQLWQVKNDFKQELQNLSDSFDTKLAQNNNGSTAAINAATDKANQALAKADSLSTSTAEALSSVAASLGGNASYNTVTNSFTAPSYNSTTADGTAVTANNVGDALTNLYNGGSKYAKVNSTLSVASASGNNAIAVGGAAVASGNGAVAIGAEAKASVADGVAIGNHASVTQSGGIALGANSVANTAGGIMGYIPVNATTQQARAIQATTSTEAAVSVGDASKGVYRQITGVAAGTADTDAVNVAQLKGVNARMENINRYINDVNDRVQHVERRAYSGTALAMALSGAYLPQLNAGEQTVGVGMGSYHGYTAVGVNYKATNNNGKFSWGAGVSTTGHETGFNAGIGYKW